MFQHSTCFTGQSLLYQERQVLSLACLKCPQEVHTLKPKQRENTFMDRQRCQDTDQKGRRHRINRKKQRRLWIELCILNDIDNLPCGIRGLSAHREAQLAWLDQSGQ